MNENWLKLKYRYAVWAMALLLSGCWKLGEDAGPPSGNPPPPPPTTNNPPSINGQPPAVATMGTNYTFTPIASDPDGDMLTFSIQNRPGWVTFNPATGGITGMPTLGDIGTHSDIRISVSDGRASAALPMFSIDVTQTAQGSATLSWIPPTMNTDGTPLTDLTAFKIYYGFSPGNYANQIRIDNPGLSTYVVENLAPNTYYFVATAVKASGAESFFSNMAIKTVTSN